MGYRARTVLRNTELTVRVACCVPQIVMRQVTAGGGVVGQGGGRLVLTQVGSANTCNPSTLLLKSPAKIAPQPHTSIRLLPQTNHQKIVIKSANALPKVGPSCLCWCCGSLLVLWVFVGLVGLCWSCGSLLELWVYVLVGCTFLSLLVLRCVGCLCCCILVVFLIASLLVLYVFIISVHIICIFIVFVICTCFIM